MPDIDITVVREKSGGVRCIYIGCIRVIGPKPYVSENLRHDIYPVPMKNIEDALALEHNAQIEAQIGNGSTPATRESGSGQIEP